MMKAFVYYGLVLGLSLSLMGCAGQKSAAKSGLADPLTVDPFDPDRPPTARTLYVMADILASQGRDRDSQYYLERVIDEYPAYLAAYNRLAELQMRNRQFDAAIQTLTAGLKVSPDDPVLLNNLGMCRLIQKDYESALSHFTEAAGIAPERTRYRSNMATALVFLDRRDEALALYEQILPKEEALENIKRLCENVGSD
jgi:serine/threonine-protein kinase